MEGTTKTLSLETLSDLFSKQEETPIVETSEEIINEEASQEEEVIVEEEITPKSEETPIIPNTLTKTIKNLVEKGTWTDYSLNVDGEEYESIEDLISKVEVSEELFEALAEKQLEIEKDKLSSNSISI